MLPGVVNIPELLRDTDETAAEYPPEVHLPMNMW